MKRTLRPDEQLLWSKVAATIRPTPGRMTPTPLSHPVVSAVPPPPATAAAAPLGKTAPRRPVSEPTPSQPRRPEIRPVEVRPIEPGRMRRLAREREAVGPRLDLHGLNQDQARATLTAFLRRAHNDGWRAVMVITGKGSRGDGVLRRYTPEWLASPDLKDVIAGVAEAHRRHGGEGALYVALKRRPRE